MPKKGMFTSLLESVSSAFSIGSGETDSSASRTRGAKRRKAKRAPARRTKARRATAKSAPKKPAKTARKPKPRKRAKAHPVF